jgi:soluble lytic murein transglycosylase-like protein
MVEPRFKQRFLTRDGALALAAFAAAAIVVGTAFAMLRSDHPRPEHTTQMAAVPRQPAFKRVTPPRAPHLTNIAPSARAITPAKGPPPASPTLPTLANSPPTPGEIAFVEEQKLTYGQMMSRWTPTITAASKRFHVPPVWVRAVMQIESGGRTMTSPSQPITSSAGAQGLMQLMPETYDEMRKEHGLGADPFDPHDNIFAGAAYLAWLRGKYGYPQMFAAYNDGPGHLDQRLADAQLLPLETRNYLGNITAMLNGKRGHGAALARLTRPNGDAVMVDAGAVSSVRAPFPGEYAPGVLAVITTGKLRQGVTESVPRAQAILRAHGAGI